MEANELKSRIDKNMLLELMEYFGITPFKENEEYIIFPTCCHGSCSPKLYYYIETNSFNCWSQCGGQVDVISIVQEQEGLGFNQAIEWLIKFFQLGCHRGFGRPKKREIKPREIKQKEIDVTERLKTYNPSILNTFIDYQPIEWLQEGISEEVMKMFGIRFDIDSNAIIIPVKDQQDNLVGIRCRNLNEDTIDKYGKYGIYTDYQSGISYRCTTGKLLYGLNVNMKKIIERKKIIIVEGEKSVQKSKTWYGDEDITVASYGAGLSNFQIELIKSLGVEDILFCYDREEEEKIVKKINNTYKKTAMMFNVYYIEDYKGLIDLKESPLDRGLDVYNELLMNKQRYNMEV